ncbi:MAG: DASS family sodium-coupled anion symporter [Bacteroidota bacterium]
MSTSYSLIKKIDLLLGPLLFLAFYNWPSTIISAKADPVVAVALWMIVWWMSEAVSISVTALLPLVLFPLLGLQEMEDVGAHYGDDIVFLFFGGFVLALALEKVNLHRRIALRIIRWTGTTPDRVILGFMLATAFLSMWISNTATTVVMLPIALSVIDLIINDEDGFTKGDRNFTLSIMLGIAYSANVGGIATIIGTPPNGVLISFLEKNYDTSISFFRWLVLGLPFTTVMLFAVYWMLVKWIFPNHLAAIPDSDALIDGELDQLGPLRGQERQVLAIFAVTILLWITHTWINPYLPGTLKFSNAIISMMGAFACFVIPFRFGKGTFILEWKDTVRLPWGILILFGGGLALASALKDAGLIGLISEGIAAQKSVGILAVTALLITVVLFATELMSNVALIAVFAPAIAGIALGIEVDMLYLLIPAAMASSCAFMLPMATPPNAIVFASGHVKVHEMARVGLVLNILAVLLLILYATTMVPLVF